MRDGMMRVGVGAVLLALAGGCNGEDETLACSVAADCADAPALADGQVYACREARCTAEAQPFGVFGLEGDGRTVHRLGRWPQLAAGTPALFDVLAPDDRGLDPAAWEVFLGGYLATDGERLLSGYTKPDVSGQVAVHTLGGATRYAPVPGNFAASGASGVLLVNGTRSPSLSAGAAVWALRGEGAPAVTAHTGTAASASGPVAVATNGSAVFGYADPADGYRTRLFALPAAAYAASNPEPTDVGGGTELALGETFDVAAFGPGVAVLRGTQDPKTYARTYADVVRVELAGGAAATPGAPVAVLRFVDQCSRVSLEAPMGQDLLVRVSDHAGKERRLVRLTRRDGATPPARTAAADCATAARDAALHTLELQPGFAVVDSTALPDGVGAVTVVPEAP